MPAWTPALPIRARPGREGEAWRLLVLLFTEALSSYMLRPVVPLLAVALGAGPAIAGTLLATQEAVSALVRIPAGAMAVVVGRRSVLLVCFVGGMLAAALFVLAPSIGWLFLAQVLWGASTASFWPVQWAYLTDLAMPQQNAAVVGFGMGVSGLGLLVGPLAGGAAADAWGMRAPFALVGFLMVASFAVVWMLPRWTGRTAAGELLLLGAARAGRRALAMLRHRPVAASCAGSFINQTVDGASTVFIPLQLHAAGLPIAAIGALITMRKATTVLMRFLFPALNRRLPLSAIVAAGFALDLGGLTAFALAGQWWWLALAALVSGTGGGVGEPAAKTLVANSTRDEQRDLGLSVEGTALVIGRATGAVGLGVLAATAGVTSAMLAAMLMLAGLATGVALWWRQVERPRPAAAMAFGN
ncbi:MAG: MFS transporter [Armatimonadota bacterium]|nr:MFS transporter [Armatimonadota bacterium]